MATIQRQIGSTFTARSTQEEMATRLQGAPHRVLELVLPLMTGLILPSAAILVALCVALEGCKDSMPTGRQPGQWVLIMFCHCATRDKSLSTDIFSKCEYRCWSTSRKFVVKLEKFLDTRREHVDISKHWEETHSGEAPSNIQDLLNTTYATLVSVYQYNSLALPFYADYAKKNGDRRLFINPGPLARWTWGQENGGDAAYDIALKNKTIFKDWWESDGFGVAHKETCSEGIYLYPYTIGETHAPTAPPIGFSDGRIGVMAGAPDFVVPVGEIPYNSTVSLKTEYMPVTMSFVASRGCDLMLVNLIRELEDAGILRPVKTGTRMYPD
ncbi:hypothetical protein PENDEC_c007G03836 [Penicillium decumbens]|uniref:Amidase domain-containing protein n=1 Tax=Penicillium decumbens TaxID=69771 RepID=A0A1V6PFZ1_PENDC|nr:hypothetical protein PENDEC_c007G03836 [Penicillium decumbens]